MTQSIPSSHRLTDRRRFLRSTAGGVGALVLASTKIETGWAADSDSEGYIDAHVHVWTPDTKKYPLRPGFRREDMKPPSFTPEELFAHCRPVGVRRVVLIQMSFYRFDNSYMLDMIRQYPGVFSGVAVIDEDAQPRATMLRLAQQGVRGFRISPFRRPQREWLQGTGMKTMWKCGGENGLAMCPLINPRLLPSIDRMCEQFPDTKVVVDHFGRVGIDGQIRKEDLDNLCRLARHKNAHVKVSAYYALGKKQAPYTDLGPMIRRLRDAFGSERLMWASDCPFQVVRGHQYKPSIDLIQSGLDFLTDNDRQWILRRTAQRVFF